MLAPANSLKLASRVTHYTTFPCQPAPAPAPGTTPRVISSPNFLGSTDWILPQNRLNHPVISPVMSSPKHSSKPCTIDIIFLNQVHSPSNSSIILSSHVFCPMFSCSTPQPLCFLQTNCSRRIGSYQGCPSCC